MSNAQNDIIKETSWDRVQELCQEEEFDSARKIAAATALTGFIFLANEMNKYIATAEDDYKANQEPDDFTHADGIEN